MRISTRWLVASFAALLPALVLRGASPTGGMQRISKVTFSNPLYRSLYGGVYDPAGFAYFTSSGPWIIKVDVRGTTPVEVGAATGGGGESGFISGAIDPAAGYAYIGAGGSPGRIVKFALGAPSSPPTYLGSTPLAAGENGVFGMVIDTSDPDPANHSIYAVTSTSPGIVVKLSPGIGNALPIRRGALALAAGENVPRRGVIDPAAGYAYFATVTEPAVFVKIALGAGISAPTRVGAVTLNAGEGRIGSAIIDTANGYAYLGTYSTSVVPARIVKVALGAGDAPPTRIGALTLAAGERELSTGVGDPSSGFAYFGSDHIHPAKVFKIRLGAGSALPTEEGVLQLQAGTCGTACYPADGQNISSADATLYGELYLQSSVIDPVRGRAWFGTDTVPGQAVTVQLAASPTASRLYTLAPCRVVDTRDPDGPLAGPALAANGDRVFASNFACGISPAATALVLNVTVVGPGAGGQLRLSAGDGVLPLASAISFGAGQTRSNNAVVGLSSDGMSSFAVHNDASAPVHLIVDVSGYYE